MTKKSKEPADGGPPTLAALILRLERLVNRKAWNNALHLALALWEYPHVETEIGNPHARDAYLDALFKVADLFKFIGRNPPLAVRPLERIFALDDGRIRPNLHYSYQEAAALKIGAVYEEARCPRNAAFWFRRSLERARGAGIDDNILTNLYRLAWALETAHLLDEAGDCYREIIQRLGPAPARDRALQWLVPAAMYDVTYGDSSRGETLMRYVIDITLKHGTSTDATLSTAFLAALAALGQHFIERARFVDAVALGRRLLSHAKRFDTPDWANWTAHGLIAKALIHQGEIDTALEELAQVHEVDTTAFVGMGPGFQIEALEEWIDVARIHMARGRYQQAVAAYDILAAHLGAHIANRKTAVTTRERLYWLHQQTLVVDEMASAWLTITEPSGRQATEAVVANAILQLKANLFLAMEVHGLDAIKAGDPSRELFLANRVYAAAFRQVETNPGDTKAVLELEDALFRREAIERTMITGDMIPDPAISRMLHRDFREISGRGDDRLFIDYTLLNFCPPQNGLPGTPQGQRYLGIRLAKRDITIVELPDAATIEGLCQNYMSAIVSEGTAPMRHLHAEAAPPHPTNESDIDTLSEAIYERVLAPFAPLPRSVSIAPAGILAALPFHALLRQDRYLIEDVDVVYSPSLLTIESLSRRQLSPGGRYVPNVDRTAVLLGDPDYSGRREEALPGTRIEIERVATLLRDAEFTSGHKVFEDVRVFTGAEAGAHHLLDIQCPRIVHIAAHGAFQPDVSAALSQPSRRFGFYYRRWEEFGTELVSDVDRVSLASSLALAPSPAARQDLPQSATLTALEVGSLNLIGCHVVVLSACETACGTAVSGAGVLGFQHGLLRSLAKAGILTLWKVLDRETAEFMERFYRSFLEQEDVRAGYLEAVRRTCRNGDRRVHPYYWAGFLFLDQGYYHPVF